MKCEGRRTRIEKTLTPALSHRMGDGGELEHQTSTILGIRTSLNL
jgi:hypothetical protein